MKIKYKTSEALINNGMNHTTMKVFVISLALVGFVVPQAFASCIVNEDWSEAPCLDNIGNGYYNQDDVNRWAEYYQYKGTEFMEQKRAEMNNAIGEGNLKEWVGKSVQNENVYSYYYFSGRAPDIGIYHAQFGEFTINESTTIHDPYTDDERYQLASERVPLGGLGIDPQFNLVIISLGATIGIGITIGLLIYFKKRK